MQFINRYTRANKHAFQLYRSFVTSGCTPLTVIFVYRCHIINLPLEQLLIYKAKITITPYYDMIQELYTDDLTGLF